MGACDQRTTEAILDFFYENGGRVQHSMFTHDVCTEETDQLQATSSIRRTTTSSVRASSGSGNG